MRFETASRDWDGPMRSHQSRFEYLCRSNRPEADKVRDLLDIWLSRYPVSEVASLTGRIRSLDDDVHLSAFFELALHEFLLKVGCRILEIEPDLPRTRRSPDFLVEDPSGTRFYLEAAVATGRPNADTAAQNRLVQAIRAIEDVMSPNHFLDVDYDGMPTRPIRLRLLKSQLAAWVRALPVKASAGVVPFRFSENGLSFEIAPIPRDGPVTDASERSIGAITGEAFCLKSGINIRDVVAKKASRYGSLDAPYVIAVNGLAGNRNEQHTLDALLGSTSHSDRTYDQDGFSRDGHAIWVGPDGARKRNVSAVLSVDRLLPWSVSRSSILLIHNPWATSEFPSGLSVDELRPRDDRFERVSGESLAQIFGLAPGWPED